MAVAGGAIWLSLHNAAQLRCYNATTRDQLAEINITPQVTKMLHGKLKAKILTTRSFDENMTLVDLS